MYHDCKTVPLKKGITHVLQKRRSTRGSAGKKLDVFLDMVWDMFAAFDDFIYLGGGDNTLYARSYVKKY